MVRKTRSLLSDKHNSLASGHCLRTKIPYSFSGIFKNYIQQWMCTPTSGFTQSRGAKTEVTVQLPGASPLDCVVLQTARVHIYLCAELSQAKFRSMYE